jgi:hypothetical protein
MNFHSNYESLHQHVSKDALPEEFGGNCGKIDNSMAVTQVNGMKDFFIDLKKCAFEEGEE